MAQGNTIAATENGQDSLDIRTEQSPSTESRFGTEDKKSGVVNSHDQQLLATTASQKKSSARSSWSFSENQPPHLRYCLPEQVLLQSEAGELDLSVKLSDLSSDSYFAVHYGYLKQVFLPTTTSSTVTTDLGQ